MLGIREMLAAHLHLLMSRHHGCTLQLRRPMLHRCSPPHVHRRLAARTRKMMPQVDASPATVVLIVAPWTCLPLRWLCSIVHRSRQRIQIKRRRKSTTPPSQPPSLIFPPVSNQADSETASASCADRLLPPHRCQWRFQKNPRIPIRSITLQ